MLIATHLHRGRVAPVCSSEPAVRGALVDVHILEVNVHTHHATAGQEDAVTVREIAPLRTVLGRLVDRVVPNDWSDQLLASLAINHLCLS